MYFVKIENHLVNLDHVDEITYDDTGNPTLLILFGQRDIDMVELRGETATHVWKSLMILVASKAIPGFNIPLEELVLPTRR